MYANKRIGLSVVNYNSGKKLKEVISKVGKYEAIDKIAIMDNASPDDSLEELAAIENDSKIELFKLDKNYGWSYAQNVGCKFLKEKCNVDYIIIMSPANRFDEGTVQALVKALLENKEYAVLGPLVKDENGERLPKYSRIGWDSLKLKDIFLSNFVIYRWIKNRKDNITYDMVENYNGDIFPVDVVYGAFYMIDADTLMSVGYFDSEIFLCEEEEILFIKINKKGLKEGILRGYNFYHRVGYSAKRSITKLDAFKNILNSRKIIAKKYFNVSPGKLNLLKIAQNYSLFEKKIIEAARSLLRK